MTAYTQQLLATWSDGQRRDIHADMMALTLRIVGKALFDADIADEARELGAALPFALAQLDRIVFDIIAQRRASGDDRADLLSLLISAQDEDGSRMTDRQVRDEAMTLILAGHETTALALSWSWYLLTKHPELDSRLHQEVRSVLGDRAPSLEDLDGSHVWRDAATAASARPRSYAVNVAADCRWPEHGPADRGGARGDHCIEPTAQRPARCSRSSIAEATVADATGPTRWHWFDQIGQIRVLVRATKCKVARLASLK